MSFTVKYRSFEAAVPSRYDPLAQRPIPVEQLHGPYAMVCQGHEGGDVAVYCHDEHGDCRITFGPWLPPERTELGDPIPRPTVYVMNAAGATVAKYDL